MRRRILMLVASVVVALAGTLAVFAYVARMDAQATAEERMVNVLVAGDVVTAGMTGQEAADADLVQLREYPSALVPVGALTGLDAIRDSVAASEIQPGEVVVSGDFVSRQIAGTMEIPEDDVAITVKVADYQRVADFVKPGLDVAVFHTFKVEYPRNPADPMSELMEEDVTSLLLPRAKVIGIGPTAVQVIGGTPEDAGEGTAPEQEEPAALVTLSVPITEAQKVVHAQRVGEGYQDGALYLSLLTDRSNTDVPEPARDKTFLEGVPDRDVSSPSERSADQTQGA